MYMAHIKYHQENVNNAIFKQYICRHTVIAHRIIYVICYKINVMLYIFLQSLDI